MQAKTITSSDGQMSGDALNSNQLRENPDFEMADSN
jgi:hypothetical protein